MCCSMWGWIPSCGAAVQVKTTMAGSIRGRCLASHCQLLAWCCSVLTLWAFKQKVILCCTRAALLSAVVDAATPLWCFSTANDTKPLESLTSQIHLCWLKMATNIRSSFTPRRIQRLSKMILKPWAEMDQMFLRLWEAFERMQTLMSRSATGNSTGDIWTASAMIP